MFVCLFILSVTPYDWSALLLNIDINNWIIQISLKWNSITIMKNIIDMNIEFNIILFFFFFQNYEDAIFFSVKGRLKFELKY